MDAGDKLGADQVRNECENHVRKQSAGAFSTTLRSDPPSGLDAALRGMQHSEPGSDDWKAAKQIADLAADAKHSRGPQLRHSIRIGGLYVDLSESGSGWLRPSIRDPSEALKEIGESLNDYAAERDRLSDGTLDEQDYPAMARARLSMPSEVTLLQPRRP